MAQRGRKSAGDLSAVASVTAERPEPPSDLDAEEAAEWRSVVARLRPEWFPRETHAVLAQYCRHVVAARHVSEMIHRRKSEGLMEVEEYDRLLKMQEREGRAITSLATKMRLTQQSTYEAKKTKGATDVRKPWESRVA